MIFVLIVCVVWGLRLLLLAAKEEEDSTQDRSKTNESSDYTSGYGSSGGLLP